ncbi:hypothetical protein G7Y89_g9100 [Cudoniella acicularis]|uniref:RNA-dependent RNA polymerase n=1 Tax=Cudoniella acicularis TaxID=354080 RepID=A0A8H4RG90_9HELO|nr:hypothetical protein G7Y89_g9100 [Cudoniella acicularis]
MEVTVRNVHEQTTEKALCKFLKGAFKQISISVDNFNCHKNRGKNTATLTFLHAHEGLKFLQNHGSRRPGGARRSVPYINRSRNLIFLGKPIYCEQSKWDANPYLLRVLRTEDAQRKAAHASQLVKVDTSDIFPISLGCISLSCGVWAYKDSNVVFSPQVELVVEGIAKFWQRTMILNLTNGLRLEFRYSATYDITIDDGSSPSFLFSMCEPPHFFEQMEVPLHDLLAQLGVGAQARQPNTRRGPTIHRLPYLNEEHKPIAGSCLVYRIVLKREQSQPGELGGHMQQLRKARAMPPLHHHNLTIYTPSESYTEGFARLDRNLSGLSNPLPFVVSFQIQKLAQDGYLPPSTAISLIPYVIGMWLRSPTDERELICVGAIRRLFNQIPYAGPDIEAEDLALRSIVSLLKENEGICKRQKTSKEKEAIRSGNVAIIHRVKITPSGIHLYGPEPEANNRVLRKYPNNHDSFLRVQFCDEDGGMLNFDPNVSLEKIYHGRFKSILHKGIKIANRTFTFLGFSHSSLRAHSCWFAAPFLHEGTLLWGRLIVEDLGNFADIRSPAKCAARIGQAFTDTRTAVPIPLHFIAALPEVERNGRVFSDGVGTMSPSVMEMICDRLPKKSAPRPTCLQIRFQGAKGMISLDPRLQGDSLNLRPSMVKFFGSNSQDVEICGAAYTPLPAYLNRQFIKILEDMGVSFPALLKLQNKEVTRLRNITNNPWDVSMFLHRQSIGKSLNLARFIQELAFRNLDFRQDPFLRNVLEATLLIELRLLKHKTRIPIEKGHVLHGIMDETGYLEEGQIFCTFNDFHGRPQILTQKRVLVSRAPALHPGDVQILEAVKPPADSPLRRLSNCICFSQKGFRDLPSQLSGGDLDGDLYLVIWDETLQPTMYFTPADYPRVVAIDIGRAVQPVDITEFFIKFMETDQLGRIAIRHVVLADRRPTGTSDPDCIILAEMHSTAVDFSKTGIPVDMSKMPPSDNWRPDFMAPGPHLRIEKNTGLSFDVAEYQDPRERWDENEDNKGYRFYESNKILGKLYRAIDERAVLQQIYQREFEGEMAARSPVIDGVWTYVKQKCRLILWEHHKEWAREIRDMYEDCLLNAMTAYSDHPLRPLSELEAFIGNILGKTGAASKRQRDQSTTLKERVDEDTAFIVDCILKDDGELSEEALPRSMACLAVSLEERIMFKRQEQILSFKYVAAAVCMREAEKLPGFEVLPPLDLPSWLAYSGQM